MPGPSDPTIVAPATTEGTTRQKLKQFSWEEIHKHRSRKDCWIVVKGKVYDVSSWVAKHPGGDIILNGGGREATGMFLSYHPLYVSNKLPQFLIGEVADYHPYYDWDQSEFYTVLKQRVEKYMKENKLSGDPPGIYLKTLAVAIGWFATYYYGLIQGSFIGAFLFGIFHSHLGISISHDGCHGSYSKNKTVTRLASFMMDLMGGSRLVWFMQHNIGHHPNCNRQGTSSQPEDYDPDVRSGTPIMRFNEGQSWQPYHRYQHIYIWLLFAGVGVKWFINDIRAVLREKYLTFDFFEITPADRTLLLITKAMFVLYSFVVPIYIHGLVKGLSLMFLFWSVTSYMFALNFAVNHLTEDNHFPRENNQPVKDWAKLQVITSSNFGTSNPFCTWITGGLNYQIEHHLFPGVNHVYLAQISPIVKQTCKEYGLKYTDYPGYWDALVAYYNHVRNMGTGPVPKKKIL